LRVAIAALVGMAVGLERQWSGHSTGEHARFAGIRTFLMLGLSGGAAGLLLSADHDLAAAAIIAGATALCVAAYVMTVRRAQSEIEGTTEAAAVLVVALGALAGQGMLFVAAGAGAVVVLALNEKERLHRAVTHLREEELRAALRFGVMALVILPLLPVGPLLGALQFRPRSLWVIVLLFSAINFAAFVARRAAGARHGYGLVGMLGGQISSTAVTFDFARRSRAEPELSASLASGVIGACTVLIPRVFAVSLVLNAGVALALVPLLLPAALVGATIVALDWFRREREDVATGGPSGNPLRLTMAVRMALLFQLAMTAIHYARQAWSVSGLYATSAILGVTDVDALTVAMNRPETPMVDDLAARAITLGILSNTAFKTMMATALGAPRFRIRAVAGLLAIGAAVGAAMWLL